MILPLICLVVTRCGGFGTNCKEFLCHRVHHQRQARRVTALIVATIVQDVELADSKQPRDVFCRLGQLRPLFLGDTVFWAEHRQVGGCDPGSTAWTSSARDGRWGEAANSYHEKGHGDFIGLLVNLRPLTNHQTWHTCWFFLGLDMFWPHFGHDSGQFVSFVGVMFTCSHTMCSHMPLLRSSTPLWRGCWNWPYSGIARSTMWLCQKPSFWEFVDLWLWRDDIDLWF